MSQTGRRLGSDIVSELFSTSRESQRTHGHIEHIAYVRSIYLDRGTQQNSVSCIQDQNPPSSYRLFLISSNLVYSCNYT